MKKMLFAVTALAALSLLAPTTGFAQGARNQLGFYADDAMGSARVDGAAYANVEIFLLVSNPYNEIDDRPIESISGVEIRFILPPGVALDSATSWTNGTATDFGNTNDGHFVGWGTPVPVVDGICHLATKTIFLLSADGFTGLVAPHSINPSNPGHMAILDFDGTVIQNVHPSSGDYDLPVVGFNDDVVATDETSFDQLKALYR